jgi:hypothetical protein
MHFGREMGETLIVLFNEAGVCSILQPAILILHSNNNCINSLLINLIATYLVLYYVITKELSLHMKKLQLIIGCNNTLNAIGDTAKSAGKGAVNIIQGVGNGVNHIGKGVKTDLTSDDREDKKEK